MVLGFWRVEGSEWLWGLVGRWWSENWLLFWIWEAGVVVPAGLSAALSADLARGHRASVLPLWCLWVLLGSLWRFCGWVLKSAAGVGQVGVNSGAV